MLSHFEAVFFMQFRMKQVGDNLFWQFIHHIKAIILAIVFEMNRKVNQK